MLYIHAFTSYIQFDLCIWLLLNLFFVFTFLYCLKITPALASLSSMVESYYNTGMEHSKAATGFGSALSDVAKSIQNDKDISEPILKVQ